MMQNTALEICLALTLPHLRQMHDRTRDNTAWDAVRNSAERFAS